MKKILLLLAAVVLGSLCSFAQDYLTSDYYMIGSNVNGKSWSLAQPDAKFKPKGAGIYEWNGDVLGTGFKINNGSWENSDFNFGSGTTLDLNTPYYCYVGGSSGNIGFSGDFTELKNPKVILDVSNAPEEVIITVSGREDGIIRWYITGTFNDWAIDNAPGAIVLEETTPGEFEAKGVEFTTATMTDEGYNTFKIAKTGWSVQYGLTSDIIFFDYVYDGELGLVGGEGGACPFYHIGKFDVKWQPDFNYVRFTRVDEEPDPKPEPEEPDYLNSDYYIIGNNVNGETWTLSASAAKFEDMGEGIFEWNGEVLGSGFKINNGSWDDVNFDFGGNWSDLIELGEPFYCSLGGSDIYFTDEITELKNPKVILDVSNAPDRIFIIVTGEAVVPETPEWYVFGTIDGGTNTMVELKEDGPNRFVAENVRFASLYPEYDSNNQVAIYRYSTGTIYAASEYTEIVFNEKNTSATLFADGVRWCELTENGLFNVEWNPSSSKLTLIKVGETEPAPVRWYIRGNIEDVSDTYVQLLPVGENKYVAEKVRFTENPEWTENHFVIQTQNSLAYYGSILEVTDDLGMRYPYFYDEVGGSGELHFQGGYWVPTLFYGTYRVEWDADTHVVSFTRLGGVDYQDPDKEYLESDYYIIGSDVNGNVWTLESPDAKFENKGDGIFEWNGEVLGSGFKINNGTWDNDKFIIGAGSLLTPGAPYYCEIGGGSGNIKFDGNITKLKNPKVILDVSNAPNEVIITVTGEEEFSQSWSIFGTIDGEAYIQVDLQKAGDNRFVAENVKFASADGASGLTNLLAIRDLENGVVYASPERLGTVFNVSGTPTELVPGGEWWCSLIDNGYYDVEWDSSINSLTLTWVDSAEPEPVRWFIEGNIQNSDDTMVELLPVGENEYAAKGIRFTDDPYSTGYYNRFAIRTANYNQLFGALPTEGVDFISPAPFHEGHTSGVLHYQGNQWCLTEFYGVYTVVWNAVTHEVSFTKTGDIVYDPEGKYLNSDYYMIGSNVNGNGWTLAAEDAKFENKGNGIFEWYGEYLGTGFKINNGSWDDVDFNFGSSYNDDGVHLSTPYEITISGSSGNIIFGEDADGLQFAGLRNPHVILDVSKAPYYVTITVTGGENGLVKWYITGTFNNWTIYDEDANVAELVPVGNGEFEAKNVLLSEETAQNGCNFFKIVKSGWMDQFGSLEDYIYIDSYQTECELETVPSNGEEGMCPIYLFGEYDVRWNATTHVVSFTKSNLSKVAEVGEADDAEVMYFTPDGIRIPEPSKGLYIKVQGNKVTKVIR